MNTNTDNQPSKKLALYCATINDAITKLLAPWQFVGINEIATEANLNESITLAVVNRLRADGDFDVHARVFCPTTNNLLLTCVAPNWPTGILCSECNATHTPDDFLVQFGIQKGNK